MWRCSECQEKIEDNFEVCWQCGTTKMGEVDAAFIPEIDAKSIVEAIPKAKSSGDKPNPMGNGEAFAKGGVFGCLAWIGLGIAASMVGGAFRVDLGGGLMLFLIGGIIGLMINSSYRSK